GAGCSDTNNNSVDFTVAAPLPRNRATAAAPCDGSGGGGGGGGVGATPLAAAIYAIQGSGATSTLAGQLVVTSGVVTKLTNQGFFLQDAAGDGRSDTSDGIFVFTGATAFPAAQVGSLVQVTGTVAEFNVGASGNADTAARPVTQLGGVTSVALLGSGATIAPTVVTLPLAAGDSLERFEGMLVRIASALTVQQNFFQARYGQLTLGAGGRHETPTNRHRPSTAQALALADLQARSRLVLDDGSSLQNVNPTPYFGSNGVPRAGDTLASVTGVIDYGLATASNTGAGLYRIHPTEAPAITASNPRAATPPAVGGNLRLASMNVLNYFTTFTDGSTATGQSGQGCLLGGSASAGNCRGANNLAEFNRQRSKIVRALAALNADAVGLMEIQNNGSVAVQNLVDALNATVGAGTYAAVPDPANGTGDDAIKVAMIYKPARLVRWGASVSDTAAINNRPTLAQSFAAANGERFTLVVNHLKSKGSCPAPGTADADQGDGQGCWNATRLQQAQQLRNFVSQLQGSSGSNDVLLVGDFNAYGQEDPIHALTSNGFVDQMSRFSPLAYSYVFDGTAGRLDHGISSASMSARVAGAAHWHIDADESVAQDYNLEFKQPACPTCAPDAYDGTVPFRASDHDPALLGVHLYKTILGTTGRDLIVGTAGDDIIVGGAGADTLTGGAGIDLFSYGSMRDAGDTVTDFVPGKDLVDLRALLAGLGYAGTNPVAEGWVRFVAVSGGTSVQVDADGPGTALVFRPLLTLVGVSPASLSATRDLAAR
ncbi:MAG: ExeM/NucH family extracellular endonuclease, partial [Aquabacterium sp.]|nr:ExeM/NucH family extracellular endonuclease [Aquabacterium sp.]